MKIQSEGRQFFSLMFHLAEREGFSRLSPNLNVFNGFEPPPYHLVYQLRVLKSSSHQSRLPGWPSDVRVNWMVPIN
jgi:hypothetical protein